jgi:hypothetical protein
MSSKRYVNVTDISFSMMPYYRLIIVAVVYLLLAPFLGPMLDHHFAERQHNHQHIHFGSGGTKHVHFYDLLHLHSHTHNTPVIPPSNGLASHEPPNEVIYLTSQYGVGQSAPSFTIPELQVDFVFPDLGDNRFLRRPTSQDSLPPKSSFPLPRNLPQGSHFLVLQPWVNHFLSGWSGRGLAVGANL